MAEIILKDSKKREKTFNVEEVRLMGSDGEYVPFTFGGGNPVLQEKTITENGEYTADVGFDALGKVLVNVIGSGSNVVKKSGSFNNKTSRHTVTHGLGVIPDLIIVMADSKYSQSKAVGTTGLVYSVGGRSTEFLNFRCRYGAMLSSGTFTASDDSSNGIETTDTSSYFISSATENDFSVPPCIDNILYHWVAFTGLSKGE